MRTYELDINEDYGRTLDLMLKASKVKRAFFGKGNREWIDRVNYGCIKEGLRSLNDMQLTIIEMLIMEDRCISDVCVEFCLTIDELNSEITEIRHRLISYM